MPTFALSPGSYLRENDISIRVSPIATSISALVLASDKGSLDLFFSSSNTNFLAQYGNPDTKLGFGHHSALAFLTVGTNLWSTRVVNGAQWANLTYVTDREGPLSKHNTPIPGTVGLTNDFNNGAPDVQGIIFDGPFITNNTVNVEVVVTGEIHGLPVNADLIASVPFNTTSDQTLLDLANAIHSTLNSVATGAIVNVMPATVVNGSNNRIVRLFSPLNVQVAIINVDVTGGTTQANGSVEDLKLFDVLGVDPGSWANNIGVQIAAIDKGIPQILQISFSNMLMANNVVNMSINGNALPTVPYNSNNDQTLDDIATAIVTYLGTGSTAAPVVIGGGNNNDRQIIVTAPDATADIIINNVIVSGGTNQVSATITQIVDRIPPDNTFLFNVYDITKSVVAPVEQFTVSLAMQNDGYGAQQNIMYAVNQGPNSSKYIRIYQPEWSQDVILKNTQIQITLLTYGYNGLAPTANNYMAGSSINGAIVNGGWALFSDREAVDIRILINGGVTIPAVQKYMTQLALTRQDCIAILDMPSNFQSPQKALNYRRNTLNINSSYAAIYTPDLYIQDTFTNSQFYVPPSGYMAAIYAYTDKNAATWFAPAGLNRANLSTQILGLRFTYNQGDRDLMYPAQINFIRNMPGIGYPVWAAVTLQSAASALSNINVRRLMIYMEISILNYLIYEVFEPNDDFTRQAIVDTVTQFANPIMHKRGLLDFMVVSDKRNNSASDEDQGILNVEFLVKPTIPAVFLLLTSTITSTSASFSELVVSGA